MTELQPIVSDSPIFTVAEAATYLKVGRRVVYRLCALKKLSFRVVDERGTIRIHRDVLDVFIGGAK